MSNDNASKKSGSKLVSLEQLAIEYGIDLNTQQLLVLERKGLFPRRRRIGERRVAWVRAELDAWLASVPFADDVPAPGAPIKGVKAAAGS